MKTVWKDPYLDNTGLLVNSVNKITLGPHLISLPSPHHNPENIPWPTKRLSTNHFCELLLIISYTSKGDKHEKRQSSNHVASTYNRQPRWAGYGPVDAHIYIFSSFLLIEKKQFWINYDNKELTSISQDASSFRANYTAVIN